MAPLFDFAFFLVALSLALWGVEALPLPRPYNRIFQAAVAFIALGIYARRLGLGIGL